MNTQIFCIYIDISTHTQTQINEIAKESDNWEFEVGWVIAGAPVVGGGGHWAAAVAGEAWCPLTSEKEIKRFSRGIIDSFRKGCVSL